MKTAIVVLILVILGAGSYFYLTPRGADSPAPGQATVAATIFPIFDIARLIAGDAINVELILAPGASPHTFDPSPSTLRALEGSEVIFYVGHGLDEWALDLVRSLNAEAVILDQGISLRENNEEGHHEEDAHEDEHEEEEHHDDAHEDEDAHGHDHGPTDPHYWLDSHNGERIAKNIAADLSARYPEHREIFEENLNEFLEEAEEVEEEIRELISEVDNTQIITLHDAWYYFANAYGLEIVGTFEPTAGREPTPQYLAELSHEVEETGVSVIYSEPQFGTAGLDAFADDHNLTIAELDPIGGIEGRESYFDLLRYNAQVIKDNQ